MSRTIWEFFFFLHLNFTDVSSLPIVTSQLSTKCKGMGGGTLWLLKHSEQPASLLEHNSYLQRACLFLKVQHWLWPFFFISNRNLLQICHIFFQVFIRWYRAEHSFRLGNLCRDTAFFVPQKLAPFCYFWNGSLILLIHFKEVLPLWLREWA